MTGQTRTMLLGGAVALLGSGAIVAAAGIGSGSATLGPRMVPTLAGLVMVIAGIAIGFERAIPDVNKAGSAGREVKAIWLVLLSSVYILGIGMIGYLAATAIAAPALRILFGTTGYRKLIAASILCPAVLHIFFFELLGIFPPRAAWFDLVDLLGL